MTSVSDNIETENDRVSFLTSICHTMSTKARLNLKAKNLYAADGRAVKELLKIASVLYAYVICARPASCGLRHLAHRVKFFLGFRLCLCLCMCLSLPLSLSLSLSLCLCVCLSAMKANKAAMRGSEPVPDATAMELPQDTSATRAIASEITARGAKLFDLLKDEQELRDARMKVGVCSDVPPRVLCLCVLG